VGGFDPASQCEQRPGQGQGLFLGEFASLARPLQSGAETANVHNQGNLTAVNANSPTAILDRPSIAERPLWGRCSGSDGDRALPIRVPKAKGTKFLPLLLKRTAQVGQRSPIEPFIPPPMDRSASFRVVSLGERDW